MPRDEVVEVGTAEVDVVEVLVEHDQVSEAGSIPVVLVRRVVVSEGLVARILDDADRVVVVLLFTAWWTLWLTQSSDMVVEGDGAVSSNTCGYPIGPGSPHEMFGSSRMPNGSDC